ncbi:MAG: cytosine deaminase [Chthoniobacterales bacterium]|nr:MAG: cytosine deaminase [Chthoniobacterales bacterium]
MSWTGWLLMAGITLLGSYVLFVSVYPFLAVTDRVPADTLVVEGWVHEYAAHEAAAEYYRDGYAHLLTTGGPVVGKGGYVNDFQTSASVGAELLKKAGIPSTSVQMVPSRVIGRDRTFSSAIALRDWLAQRNVIINSVNVLTEDAHARRTRLLFQKALGPKVKVGIIAVRSPDYDANRWWRCSDGVREVIGEAIAYFYAKLLFRPSTNNT